MCENVSFELRCLKVWIFNCQWLCRCDKLELCFYSVHSTDIIHVCGPWSSQLCTVKELGFYLLKEWRGVIWFFPPFWWTKILVLYMESIFNTMKKIFNHGGNLRSNIIIMEIKTVSIHSSAMASESFYLVILIYFLSSNHLRYYQLYPKRDFSLFQI